MKKILIFVSLLFSFTILSINIKAATWKMEWINTVVRIPVGEELSLYKDKPKAFLYKDGILVSEANITYSQEGDWLYFLKEVDTQRVGEYKVWYKAYENGKYSPGTCTGYKSLITFIVEDTIAPEIKIITDELAIRRGSESVDSLKERLINNVNVTDNYSDFSIVFDHNIDLSNVGRYEVLVTARDKSKNLTKDEFYVNVFEDREPILTYLNSGSPIKIPYNSKPDLSIYFTAYDILDGDISNKIKYPMIDTSIIGNQECDISVTNSAGLTTTQTLNIMIVDDEEPVINLTAHTVILDYKEDFTKFDFNKYIKNIKDNLDINYDNLSIYHNLENKVGSYQIWYEYFDGIYTVEDSIDVKLVSYTKPKILVNDIVTSINNNVNILDYLEITDESDSNIMDKISIDDSNVDYSKEGIYYVDIYVVNSSGLSNTAKVKLIVKNESIFQEDNIPFLVIIIALSVVVLGCSGFMVYYFVSRKRHI